MKGGSFFLALCALSFVVACAETSEISIVIQGNGGTDVGLDVNDQQVAMRKHAGVVFANASVEAGDRIQVSLFDDSIDCTTTTVDAGGTNYRFIFEFENDRCVLVEELMMAQDDF